MLEANEQCIWSITSYNVLLVFVLEWQFTIHITFSGNLRPKKKGKTIQKRQQQHKNEKNWTESNALRIDTQVRSKAKREP